MKAETDGWTRALDLGIPQVMSLGVRAVVRSWRVEVVGTDKLVTSPVIFAFWHGQMAPLLGGLEVVGTRTRLAMLAAAMPQARFISQVVAPLGIAFVEAESGTQALIRAARRVRDGWSLAVAVDGPAGPAFHARSGASMLSRMAGVPVVPVTASAQPSVTLEGFWDKAALPLPFARVRIAVGEPVPAPNGRSDVKAHVAEVQRQLAGATCVPGPHT
jgi:lysophospholipid acyltransferase (LPLAT)-like uncharacterized protein